MPTTALTPTGRSLLTTFGLGHLRPAPGTWGSLPPVVLAGALLALGVSPAHCAVSGLLYNLVLLGVLVVFSGACVRFGDAAEAAFGKKDPSHVVADETAGVCLPLLFLPPAAVATPGVAALTLVFAFLAFRVVDIVKPWPCHQVQDAGGGWGILLDDLLAGLIAMLCVQAVVRVML